MSNDVESIVRGFDPSRITLAVEQLEPGVLAPLVRKAADEFYGHVMQAAQDYLRDNIDFNLKSHLEMLERENARMRRELYELGSVISTPWDSHEGRMEKVREMSLAVGDLKALRYQHLISEAGKEG